MKIKYRTSKFLRLRDCFNVGWLIDNEADFSFNLTLFGREYSWDFYKKDSGWINYYYEDDDFDLEQV